MTEHEGQAQPDEELERAREKLKKLYQKVRSYADGQQNRSPIESISPVIPSASAKEIPIEEIRDKLRAINDYFRDRMAGKPAELPDQGNLAPAQVEAPSAEALPNIPDVIPPKTQEQRPKLGVGLDLGTSSIVSPRETEENRVVSRIERNVFLGVRNDDTTKGLLAKLGIKYAATAGKLYVLGDMALELSHIFNREGQRPMRIGILNPGEMESLPIIRLLVQNVLWNARAENEICCFSVPAKIMDGDSDAIYHKGVFERILTELGFTPAVVDEGYAVVLSELADKEFTGIGISCGAGLVNVCAAFKSVPVLSFSISRGGDWIDKNAATALGMVSSNTMAIKEQGIHLLKPNGREGEAISIYYRSYIHYFLENIAKMFSGGVNAPQFTKPVDIVFAGGSCLAGGFLEVVKDELKMTDLGIPVGRIRRAEEPLLSVSRGCLFHAMNLTQATQERK